MNSQRFCRNFNTLIDTLGRDRVRLNEPMSLHTTYRIGGPADLFFQAENLQDICQSVRLAQELKISFFVLGLGANILVGDRGIRGLVIKNRYHGIELTSDNPLLAASGTTVDRIIEKTRALSLSGLEHFAGIPSTVGGAIWQNLHFLNTDRSQLVFISDLIQSAVILSEEGELKKVERDYFKFGYDQCILHERHDTVLSVFFSLSPDDPEVIRKVIEANLSWRRQHHPDVELFPNAGSIFQRINNQGVGKFIDKCGLKGKSIGAARISEKHANFIVNLGGAKASDVLALIRFVKEVIYKEFQVELREEIEFIGEF